MNVRLLAGAEADLIEAAAYLQQRRQGLGSRFTDSVQRSLGLLSENANIGSLVAPQYRKLRVRRFPYNVIYRVEDDAVLVVAIAHHRRRPGYWATLR